MTESPRDHPRLRLDDSFASPIRFSLMAALPDDLELDFGTLASILQAGDSALSKGIAALESVGYVRVRKALGDGIRRRTWVSSTTVGRDAFRAHLAALQAIVDFGTGQSD